MSINIKYIIIKLLCIKILILIFCISVYSQNTWTQKANFGGVGRPSPVTFTIGNKGYAGTGGSAGIGLFTKDFWEYDPAQDSWTQKADFAGSARIYASGFSINGKGYIGIGYDGTSSKDFWEYDPTYNSWTRKADFGGTGRSNAVSFNIGSKGYIGTGTDGIEKVDFWEYNPANDTWIRKTDFPGTGRIDAIGLKIGTKGYIGGGTNSISTSFQDIWEYNPNNDTWTQKNDFVGNNISISNFFSVANKGYVLIGLQNIFWEYDPLIDTWTRKANFTGSFRILGSGFSLNNKAYLGFGDNNVGIRYTDLWQYTPGTTPSVDNSQTSFIADTFALADGAISFDGNYSVTNKGFVWSTSAHPTISSHSGGGISYNGTGDSSFSDTLSGLTPLTIYYYRAYATNSQGTSYSEEFNFTSDATSDADIDGVSNTIENNAPNGGDGNFDGTLDANQANVTSILTNNGYITIQVLNFNSIKNVSILNNTTDINWSYPVGQLGFTIPTNQANIKIYYHNISNLNAYNYRKLGLNNKWMNFGKVTFGTTIFNGRQIATASFTLKDGEEGDSDGIVNGSISDPGGPAIEISAAIPIWDWKWRGILVISFLLIIWIRLLKSNLF